MGGGEDVMSLSSNVFSQGAQSIRKNLNENNVEVDRLKTQLVALKEENAVYIASLMGDCVDNRRYGERRAVLEGLAEEGGG